MLLLVLSMFVSAEVCRAACARELPDPCEKSADLKDSKQSVSETTRETSFRFSGFRAYFNTLFKNSDHLSDD